MQLEFGSADYISTSFSQVPVRLICLIAAVLVVIAPFWITPSLYSQPITLGGSGMFVFFAVIFFTYQTCVAHRETLYSRAAEDGITVVYSAIPGILSQRQLLEESIPWQAIKEFIVLESEDSYWLNAVLVHGYEVPSHLHCIQLTKPGAISGVEAKQIHETLNKMRLSNRN
jgi:hypothetical protein